MFTEQQSPRSSWSHDFGVSRESGPNLHSVEALHKVMFNQQKKGSVAMTHESSIQVHQKTCTVIPLWFQRVKSWKGNYRRSKKRPATDLNFLSSVMETLTSPVIYKDSTYVVFI